MRNINIIRFIAVSFTILIALLVYTGISRIGKIPVTILASPENSEVFVDGDKRGTGTIYLTPEQHTITGKKQGWEDQSITFTVSDENNDVALVLDPNSEEAAQEANKPGTSELRESLAGIAASNRGSDLRAKTPIIEQLPYADISGPFKIDYGYNQNDTKKIYLLVSFSSPQGRQEAIQWLKRNKVDVTTTEVIFEDFTNPATSNKDIHD